MNNKMIELPNIEPFRQRYNDIEQQLLDPSVFRDSNKVTKLTREHSKLNSIIQLYESILTMKSQVKDAKDLMIDDEFFEAAGQEIELLEKRILAKSEELVLSMIPEDPDDGRNTIVEIRAGAGGDEASLFAADLFRMYSRYSENKCWQCECLSLSPSDTGGFKEVIFMIKGDDAWTKFKFESGVHRVQRVPITEASGRIHTSTATVAVLPEAKDVEIEINPSDLEVNVCRASGPGGQGVNTTDSAVQLLHIPTGIGVYCADERSQLKNKNKAMTVLRSRLFKQKQDEELQKYAKERKDQVGTGDRSERIRTYNFPQSRITDHRINYTSHALNETLMGELDHLFNELEVQDKRQKLDKMMTNEE